MTWVSEKPRHSHWRCFEKLFIDAWLAAEEIGREPAVVLTDEEIADEEGSDPVGIGVEFCPDDLFDDRCQEGVVAHINVLLEGALEEGAPCFGHAEPFVLSNVLEFTFHYGIDPKDEMDSPALTAAVAFGVGTFRVRRARLRSFWERCRLVGGCVTARERGLILPY